MVSTELVHTIRNGIFPSNTYVLSSEDSDECLVVDPGLDAEKIESFLRDYDLCPTHIIATHGHFDHVGSANLLQQEYGAQFYIHEDDVRYLKSINFFLKVMKIDLRVSEPIPDNKLTGFHNKLLLGLFEIDLFNYPGHTNGSCLIRWQNNIFTGDTLYINGLGLNSFPGEDKQKLKSSLKLITEMFEDDLMVYPGHGTCDLMGRIKSQNQDLNEFIS